MKTFGSLPIKPLPLSNLPFYHRHDVWSTLQCKSFVQFGAVKRGGNEPYCYAEEKQCAWHVCRALGAKSYNNEVLVVRDDGTVWKVCLDAFEEAHRLEIINDCTCKGDEII